MVFRDYMVRCKRCNIPYIPDNVSRIRTCVFCRKSFVEDRDERLKILAKDINRFTKTQKRMPSTDIVRTWAKLKFGVCDSTINSYLKEMENKENIVLIEENCKEKIKLLNINQPILNS